MLLALGFKRKIQAEEFGTLHGWRHNLNLTHDLIDRLGRCSSTAEICSHFLDYASGFGASNMLAGAIPPLGLSPHAQHSHVMLAAWPEEWSDMYFANGYLYRDPAIKLVRFGARPFRWSEIASLCSVSRSGRSVMEEATEFGLVQGLTFPFSTVERQAVGFSLAGRQVEVDPIELLSLQFAAAFAFGCATVLEAGHEKPQAVRLSRRQKDVIQWASDGLTTDKIADRLGISSHTVDTHLRIVRMKLGASSTIQAVAEALRRGIIV